MTRTPTPWTSGWVGWRCGRAPAESHRVGARERHLLPGGVDSTTMSGGDQAEYRFVCPDCEESLEVNASMKTALIENGCVICGAAVARAAFCRRDAGQS